jgi:putative FmdB family regulatory protein
MPVYQFLCHTCGPFERWRPFEEAADPILCPVCQRGAKRVYTAPGFSRVPPALGRVLDRARKSAYEPEVLTREQAARQEPAAPRTVRKREGRPWLLGD